MSRNKTLIKNTGWIAIGNMGAKMIGFIMLPFYTNWLNPTQYGTADLIHTYATLLVGLGALSIQNAMFVFPAKVDLQAKKEYYSTGLIFTLFAFGILALIFSGLNVCKTSGIIFEYSWFIYGMLVSSILQSFSMEFCRSINRMDIFGLTGIVNTGCIALFSLLLIPKFVLYGYIYAIIIANFLTITFTIVYTKSYRFVSIRSFNKKYLKDMLSFTIPLIPTNIMWWAISSFNRPVLEQHVELFMIGLYAVANKLPAIITLCYSFFHQAWIVTVMDEYNSKDFNTYYNKMLRLVLSSQVTVFILICIFSELIVKILTNSEYYKAWIYIPILCLGALINNFVSFTGAVLTALKKSKYLLYSALPSGITSIILNLLLIPQFGLWGACIAIPSSCIVTLIMRIYLSKKYVQYDQYSFYFNNSIFIIISILLCLIPNIYIRYISLAFILSLSIYANKKHMIKPLISFIKNKTK